MKASITLVLLTIISVVSFAAFSIFSRGYSSGEVTVTLEANKSSYNAGEDLCLHGNVTYNYYPMQMKLVAIEVRDPYNNTFLFGTRQTDSDGRFSIMFKISNQSRSGVYSAVASTDGFGKTAFARVTFEVHILGDVDANFVVDMRDISAICSAFGTYVGHPLWNPAYDLNNDGKVDFRDVSKACSNFGKT